MFGIKPWEQLERLTPEQFFDAVALIDKSNERG